MVDRTVRGRDRANRNRLHRPGWRPVDEEAGDWRCSGLACKAMLGVEGDLAMLPGFFESQTGLVESSRVTTLSANVLIHPWQARNVRPYATIGLGVVSVRVTDVADVFRTRAMLGAINGGIGADVGVSERFGFRGDARDFRTQFEDPPPGRFAVGAPIPALLASERGSRRSILESRKQFS